MKLSVPAHVRRDLARLRTLPWRSIASGFLCLSLVVNGVLWSENHYLIQQIVVASSNSQHFADTASLASAGTAAAATPAPTGDPSSAKAIQASDHFRGDRNAKVVLVEYTDFECPYCKTLDGTMAQLRSQYGDKIGIVIRNYPLSFHQNAEKEAEAAECVASLGGEDKYWNFADTIFQRTTSNGLGFALDKLAPLAQEVGVDPAAFTSCLDSGKYAKLIADQTTDGSLAGVTGTPGTVVFKADGTKKLIVGALPLATFQAEIDADLKI